MRRAKIVCTIGPASESPEMLRKLITAGLDVARLNFSHGTHEQHARTITAIREAAAAGSRPIAILQDLQGPRIRIGNLMAPISVESGQTITLTINADACDGAIPVTYSHLPADMKPGDRILIDDGSLELAVEELSKQTIRCRVVIGGGIRAHKSMKLPGGSVSAPALGAKDPDGMCLG